MKKLFCFFLALMTALLSVFPTLSASAAQTESSSAEILFEAETGQVVYSKNPDQNFMREE